MLRAFIVAALLLGVSVSAQGQQPSDALKACLADNTSGKDRKDLAKWIFLAMAAHPEMKQHASPNAGTAAGESSRTMAALVMRLLTESCVNETKAAVQNGQGAQSLRIAFEGLGQLAIQELMTDKSVQESIGLFERYVDQRRLTEALTAR